MPFKDDYLNPIFSTILKPILWLLSRSRLPQTNGSLNLKGLEKQVEILWDRWHVPHIYAQSAADAVYAQGFVHAQERLWQMDFNRRVLAGRLAEVLGEAGLPADRVMRTLGLRHVAEAEAGLVPESLNGLLNAYSAGVNAWIEFAIRRHKLPIEFTLLSYQPEPWQPVDCLGYGKLMDWILAGNWESEFLRGQIVKRLESEKVTELEIGADKTWSAILDATQGSLDPSRTFTGPHAGEGVGSNNWVVHGARTVNGSPLLANDMHLSLTAPAIWFENHLVGGDLDVSGITFPGTPLVIAGHNRYVAWGYTDGLTDVQDLYEEHLRNSLEGCWEYEFMGAWHAAQLRQENIQVKGGKSVIEEVISTCHGPVVNLLFKEAFPDTPPMSFRYSAMEPQSTVQAIYGLDNAHSCSEVYQALRWFSGPAQNTVYADTQGNIGYTLTGKIPIRAKGDGSVPVPGWTGEYEWLGYLPYEQNPHLENPWRGFVATANNRLSRQELPIFLTRDYCRADRAARIVEMIEAKSKIDIPYIQKMHRDQVSTSARKVANCLGSLDVSEPDLRKTVSQMKSWDGELGVNSHLAAVYQVTVRRALSLILTAHLGDLGIRLQGKGSVSGLWSEHSWEWFSQLLDTPDTPWFNLGSGERRDDVLKLALRQATDFLNKESASNKEHQIVWGSLHKLTFQHILAGQPLLRSFFNRGGYAIGGDGSTIWAALTSPHDLSTEGMIGPPFRFIADLGDLDHCWGALVPGQSGHPASRHYQDGIPGWFKGEYHPMLFRREEVEANLEGRMVLKTVGSKL